MSYDELLKEMPTEEWKERIEEDDDIFTEENIEEISKALRYFISQLKAFKDPTEDEILACVEEVVLKLNELNEDYDNFIETLEREELYEFIDAAAKIAGLESDEDITEEWREW